MAENRAKVEKDDQAAFLSPADLEKRWRVSKSLVYKIIHSPEFPAPLRLGVSGGAGKSLRFNREQIEAWERTNMQKKDSK